MVERFTLAAGFGFLLASHCFAASSSVCGTPESSLEGAQHWASEGCRTIHALAGPDLPAVNLQRSLRESAEEWVRKLHEDCEKSSPKKKGSAASGRFPKATEILMAVPAKYLPSIAKWGFQNIHSALPADREDDRLGRFIEEEQVLGALIPYDSRGRSFLPKYAYLDVFRPGFSGDEQVNYGDVLFVMKESVKARTTWSRSDSNVLSGTNVDTWKGGHEEGGLPDYWPAHTLKDDNGAMSTRRQDNVCSGYCEAQIWGDLNLSDVAYAMIKTGTAVPGPLVSAGIPVYRLEEPRNVPGRNMRVRRGALLSKPQPGPAVVETEPGMAELLRLRQQAASETERGVIDAKIAAATSTAELLQQLANATVTARQDELLLELAGRDSPEVRALLIAQARRPNRVVRAQILEALARHPEPTAENVVISGLSDTEFSVRMAALFAAAAMPGSPSIRTAADKLSKDQHALVRRWYGILFKGSSRCARLTPKAQ